MLVGFLGPHAQPKALRVAEPDEDTGIGQTPPTDALQSTTTGTAGHFVPPTRDPTSRGGQPSPEGTLKAATTGTAGHFVPLGRDPASYGGQPSSTDAL